MRVNKDGKTVDILDIFDNHYKFKILNLRNMKNNCEVASIIDKYSMLSINDDI
jgi:hypothetical protein